MELKHTVEMMCSADYKERFRAEYIQTRIRHDKLCAMIAKYAAGTLDFTPTCPLDLLKQQARAMQEYLTILEVRAGIEGVVI